jgi:cytochrome c-type biogenesis protein CcmH
MATSGIAALFWLALGFMAGIAAAFFAVQLWRGPTTMAADAPMPIGGKHWLERRWGIVAMLAAFTLVAIGVYALVGKPDAASTAAAPTNPGAHDVNSSAAAGSLEEATEKLAAKLAAGNGSDADWVLLQQSYEFLGDTNAAELAKQHQLEASGTGNPFAATVTSDTSNQVALASYQQVVTQNPSDATAWRAIAELQKSARRLSEASEAFIKLIALNAMDADAWADYADVRASLQGSLTDAAARKAIDRALQLDNQNVKALWLKASLAHEEHRYADAAQVWQTLRASLPAQSPDIAVIDANIAEASQLADSKTTVTSAITKTSITVAEVRGSVELTAAMKKLVSNDMILFIYAKADDSPAPVAAYRTQVSAWPMKFVLNDSHAMMPTRKLSLYQQVKIEARLSRSGQATAQPGDLQADAVVVAPLAGKTIALKISRQVP